MIWGNGRNKTLIFDDHCALKKFLLRDLSVSITVGVVTGRSPTIEKTGSQKNASEGRRSVGV
ncbi:MAG: hypothetical protein HC799_08485 [Limnothrix sp. RL_2_0]|nr:hypothetical protein [Limnothrix sp. RL_2_0]